METVIKKWGNSAAVRIPAAVFEAAKLSLDQAVDIREENGCVVVRPIIRYDYDLDSLLSEITLQNQQDVLDFGKPVGREMW